MLAHPDRGLYPEIMSVSELSASSQNYLKTIWGISEWSSEPVTTSSIAEKAGLKLSSVSDAVRKLAAQGLVEHAPYGSVALTESGRVLALAMVRRHRLIETFLVDVLGYRWDQVHDEAETLEHAVSDFMIERIDDHLDHPSRDPHGDPIPSAEGVLDSPEARQLTAVGAGSRMVVERISDENPALLQHFEEHGIAIGTVIDVSEGSPFSDSLVVSVEGSESSVSLGQAATDALYVSA